MTNDKDHIFLLIGIRPFSLENPQRPPAKTILKMRIKSDIQDLAGLCALMTLKEVLYYGFISEKKFFFICYIPAMLPNTKDHKSQRLTRGFHS